MRTPPSARSTAPLVTAGVALCLTTLLLGACASGTSGDAGSATAAATGVEPTVITPVESPTSSPAPTPQANVADAEDRPTAGTTSILTPQSGATVTGPTVTVTGTATAFEGTLLWQVVPAGSEAPVLDGFTTAGANGEIGPFELTAELAAGTYTLSVWEPDMSDDSSDGERDNLATVTFTVR